MEEDKMTELTGLELRRKACEALGWHEDPNVKGYFHSPRCKTRVRAIGHIVEGCTVSRDLPAIESDIGVAWPIFVEWCEKKQIWFELHNAFNGESWFYFVTLFRKIDDDVSPWAQFNGATPSEAIARAIVEAGEKHGTKS
jgi:hypothetical protein